MHVNSLLGTHAPFFTSNTVKAWPYAQGKLCCLTRHHFQATPTSPTPVTRLLPVSPNLSRAYYLWSSVETWGSQVLPPLSFTACHRPYSGFLSGVYDLSFPNSSGLLPENRGSACITVNRCLSLNRTLLAIIVRSDLTKLRHSLYATACGFGRHSWLSTTHSHEPSQYRVGASSARVLPHEPALCLHIQKDN